MAPIFKSAKNPKAPEEPSIPVSASINNLATSFGSLCRKSNSYLFCANDVIAMHTAIGRMNRFFFIVFFNKEKGAILAIQYAVVRILHYSIISRLFNGFNFVFYLEFSVNVFDVFANRVIADMQVGRYFFVCQPVFKLSKKFRFPVGKSKIF